MKTETNVQNANKMVRLYVVFLFCILSFTEMPHRVQSTFTAMTFLCAAILCSR